MPHENFDIIVVGGGAAGLHIAGLLAEKAAVCLLDSKADLLNVSFHTLGSFIDRGRFGLSEKIIATHISECVLHSKHVHAHKTGNAFILNKAQIHKELLDRAVTFGVKIQTHTSVRECTQKSNGSIGSVTDSKGNEYHAKIFIDATGTAGVLSRKLGLQAQKIKIATGLEYNVRYHAPEHQAHLFIGKDFLGGYGWIFPLGQNRAIFGYGTFSGNHKTHLKETLDRIITTEPLKTLVTKDNAVPYGGTIPITEVKTRFVYKNVVCIGDSVSQVHPLVGEGYRFVLEAGLIAAPHILKALATGALEHLTGYELDWNKKFQRSYKKGKLLQKIADIGSRNDILSDALALAVKMVSGERFNRVLKGD